MLHQIYCCPFNLHLQKVFCLFNSNIRHTFSLYSGISHALCFGKFSSEDKFLWIQCCSQVWQKHIIFIAVPKVNFTQNDLYHHSSYLNHCEDHSYLKYSLQACVCHIIQCVKLWSVIVWALEKFVCLNLVF